MHIQRKIAPFETSSLQQIFTTPLRALYLEIQNTFYQNGYKKINTDSTTLINDAKKSYSFIPANNQM